MTVSSEMTPSEQSTPYPRGHDRTECTARREASRDRLLSSMVENVGEETRRGQDFKDKVERKRQRMCRENPEDDKEESKSRNTEGSNFIMSKVEVEREEQELQRFQQLVSEQIQKLNEIQFSAPLEQQEVPAINN